LKLAGEIGRTGGAGARRRRREHHRALKTLGGGIHAAFTALLKAGVVRKTEAGKHDSPPRIARGRIASESTELSAHTLLEQIAIRRIPANFAGLWSRELSLCEGDFVLKPFGSPETANQTVKPSRNRGFRNLAISPEHEIGTVVDSKRDSIPD
jgi:hypothetical protein